MSFDKDGYPTQDTLNKIEQWITTETKQVHELMQYVRDHWNFADCGYWQESQKKDDCGTQVICYRLATAGWSGNEDIIGALQENILFWTRFWEQTNRGGAYIFEVPIAERTEK